MTRNKKYARLMDGGAAIDYAPALIWPNPNPPTAEEYAAAGWFEVVDEMPQTPPADGWHYEPRGWEIASDIIRRVYAEVQDPPPAPRVFDKYKLIDQLMQAGAWGRVKAWLQSQPDAYDRAVMAPDISEDEPLLASGIAAAKEAFGWTDAEVEELLSASTRGRHV